MASSSCHARVPSSSIVHGAGDYQRDESHDRHGCFFARFMIIDSTSLRAGNAHHDDGWLSNPTRSCQSINVGIIPFLSNVGHGARLGILLT